MHIVRTLVERLDDIPNELATDPGELPAINIYRIGLFAELKLVHRSFLRDLLREHTYAHTKYLISQ